jgi:hypothetical protein
MKETIKPENHDISSVTPAMYKNKTQDERNTMIPAAS